MTELERPDVIYANPASRWVDRASSAIGPLELQESHLGLVDVLVRPEQLVLDDLGDPDGSTTSNGWGAQCSKSEVASLSGDFETYKIPPWAEKCQYYLQTNGRPLKATVELWMGPIRTTHTMKVDSEDGIGDSLSSYFELQEDISNASNHHV